MKRATLEQPVRQSSNDQPRRQAAAKSDDELRRRIQLFLSSSNWPGLRRVEVSVDGDTVRLNGQLGSFHEKQLANELTKRVAGVLRICDRLQVREPAPRPR